MLSSGLIVIAQNNDMCVAERFAITLPPLLGAHWICRGDHATSPAQIIRVLFALSYIDRLSPLDRFDDLGKMVYDRSTTFEVPDPFPRLCRVRAPLTEGLRV